MKRVFVLIAVLALAAVASACGESPTGPTSNGVIQLAVFPSVAGERVITSNGNFDSRAHAGALYFELNLETPKSTTLRATLVRDGAYVLSPETDVYFTVVEGRGRGTMTFPGGAGKWNMVISQFATGPQVEMRGSGGRIYQVR